MVVATGFIFVWNRLKSGWIFQNKIKKGKHLASPFSSLNKKSEIKNQVSSVAFFSVIMPTTSTPAC